MILGRILRVSALAFFGFYAAPAEPVRAETTPSTVRSNSLPSFVNLHLPLTEKPGSVGIAAPLTPPRRVGRQSVTFTPSGAATTPAAGDYQSCDPTADSPPQAIIDLATALKNDPGLIFHYVHDNIDNDLSEESSKGALGTYLDQAGSSFDQAALLLALLQSAANSNTAITNPQIVIGLEHVTAAQFGLSALPASVLMDAGDTQSWASTSVMPYAWVQVQINGSWVVMDPAAKTYSIVAGRNLSNYATGAPSQPASASSIDSYLNGFALSAYTATVSNNNNYNSLVDLVGGRRLQVNPASTSYNPNNRPVAQLSSTSAGVGPSSTPSAYNAMPWYYRMILGITLQPAQGQTTTSYGTVCLDQIYGHTDYMYLTNFVVDGITVFNGNNSSTLSSDVFEIYHQIWTGSSSSPTWWTQTTEESFSEVSSGFMSFSTGHVGAFRANQAASAAEYAQAAASQVNGYVSLLPNVASIGASQLRQTSRGTELLDQLAGTYTINHHTMEIVHFLGSFCCIGVPTGEIQGVDTPLTSTSVGTITSTPASGLTSLSPNAVAYALSTLQSAQEAAALTQANTSNSVSAATLMASGANTSPASLITVGAGINPASNSTLSANYGASSAYMATLQSFSAGGYDLTVPASPSPWTSGATAMAFLATQAGGTSAFVLQTPNGIYKGASSTNVMGADGGTVGIGGSQPEAGPRTSGLSINAQTGEVDFAAPLLSIGGAGSPYSLAVSMSYSSSAVNQMTSGTGVAPGWAHNYQITLTQNTDASVLIGGDLTGPAIPGVVALYYLLQNANQMANYYANGGTYPVNAAYSSAATAAWYLQKAINDTVVISRGAAREPFALMPDGTYQTLSPSGEKLIGSGSNFVWTGAHGDTETFPAAGGAVTSATTANGVVTSFGYKSYGSESLLNSVSTSAHTLSFSYNTDPNNSSSYLLSQVADETGRSVAFSYYNDNFVLYKISELGDITLVDNTQANPRQIGLGYVNLKGDTWDGNTTGAIILDAVADPMQKATSIGFDGRYQAVSVTNANSHTTKYLTAGNRSEVDDALGNASFTVSYPSYSFGDLIITNAYDAVGNESITWSNYAGQMIESFPPYNAQVGYQNIYAYAYDGHGNLASTEVQTNRGVLPLTQTQWNQQWNKPAQVTDPNGKITSYTYDGNGNLNTVVEPSIYGLLPNGTTGNYQPQTSYTYAGDGQIQTKITPDGQETCYNYNAAGYLRSVVVDCANPAPQNFNLTTVLNYDENGAPAVGNVTSIVTPNGNKTSATYDAARRLLTKTNPPTPWLTGNPSLTTTYSYDPDGRPLQSSYDTGTTANGAEVYQVATQTYDNVGNLKTKTMPTTGTGTLTTQYKYDLDERLSTTTDPAGNVTTQTYDADSRPYQTFLAGDTNAAKTMLYNGDGQIYQVIDGRGNITQYGDDSYYRPTLTTYSDGTFEQLTLDNDGGTTQKVDRAGNIFAYTLDALERTTSETDTPSAQGQSTYTRSFTYDGAGRVVVLNGSGGNFTYSYDTAGRQKQTVFGGIASIGQAGYTNSYTYDSDGNTKTITYPDGYVYTYNYDGLDEMVNVQETPTGANPVTTTLVTYSYNTLGNLIQASYANGASTVYGNFDQYDHFQQIQQIGTTSSLTINYTLDQDERRVQDSFSDGRYVWHPPAADSVSYVAGTNGLNQYASINTTTGSSTTTQPLSYNTNGTLATDASAPLGAANYSWDMFNRLTGVTNSQHVARYTYDTASRRSQKVVDANVQNFAYDSDRVIAQYGTGTLPGSMQFHFIYGVGNAPFMQEEVTNGMIGTKDFYHTDAIGSTLALSSGGNLLGPGPITSPWGETTNGSGVAFRFAGMWLDGESMLYYDHARYYSPAQGRFISPDPIGVNGGINIYAYAGSDPVNDLDLDGLASPGASCNLGNQSGCGTSAGQSGDGFGGEDPGGGGFYNAGNGGGGFGHWEYSTTGGTTGYYTDPVTGLQTTETLSQSVRTWVPDVLPSPSVSSGGYARDAINGCGFSCFVTLASVLDPVVGVGRALFRGVLKAAAEGVGEGASSAQSFFRGALPGETPSFVPKPNEFRVDPATGTVLPGRGVSVFDNPGSVASTGRIPYELDLGTVPDELQIIQRGANPSHFEITPAPGANLTPEQFINSLCQICVK